MAGTLTIHRPKTFSEILEIIEAFQKGSQISWYRGCSDSSHKLQPSLYRHRTKKDFSDIAKLEGELSARFSQRSLPFVSTNMSDDWNRLFLMQHYGVPTRLLDWSENPFVSMYFALSSPARKGVNCAVWLCNPIEWNRSVLSHISFKGGVLDQTSTSVSAYKLDTTYTDVPKHPIMIYGSYNSPRIVAQRGGFALFGHDTSPMEDIYSDQKFTDGTLQKIEISSDDIESIRESLFRKGFTESVVFPDLDGLAKELRRVFGF